MIENKFYMVLPSNSSMDVYPDNKISSYKVHLPNPLDLDITKWEVALSEIQFPHLWYNVRKRRNKIMKDYLEITKDEMNNVFYPDLPKQPMEGQLLYEGGRFSHEKHKKFQFVFRQTMLVPEGYYSSAEKLTDQLNKLEQGNPRPTEFVFDEISNKVSIRPAPNCKLHFNQSDISKCLGFSQNETISERSDAMLMTSMKPYNTIYVYTDIIQNQHAGDFKVPLLRCVPVTSTYGEVCCINYNQPNFMSISSGHIESIEVNLRDDTGDLISFESGKVIVTLVFRRKATKFYS